MARYHADVAMTRDYAALLSPLCARDALPDDVRACPWLVEAGGKSWAVATDGHLCVAVLADPGASLPHCPHNDDALSRFVASEGSVFDLGTTRAALSKWAGAPKWPEPGVVCAFCGEKKRVAVKRCFFCREVKTDGTAWIEPAPLFGSISGIPVNRVLVARALSVCEDEQIPVSVSGPLDPVRFRASVWRALVMPIRWDDSAVPGAALKLRPAMAPVTP